MILWEANALFDQVNKLYVNLPEGFLKEKTDLQHQILDIYQRLIMSQEQMYATDMTKHTQVIMQLMKQAYQAAEQNNLQQARTLFIQATDMYANLPKGFLETKAELELRMLDVHNLLSLKMNKVLLDEAKKSIKDVQEHIQQAKKYVASKDYSLAKQVYMETMDVYKKIPAGFPEVVELQKELLEIYKQLIPHITGGAASGDVSVQKKHGTNSRIISSN